jgi:flagellar M-ring protein FliF
VGVQGFIEALERFGMGRLAAIMGSAFGLVAVLVMLMTHVGGDAKSLLYSNLDLKEASQITSSLDQAGIKYETKSGGSTIMVEREKVDQARLMLSSKGLPTSGSVGYEIFDAAPTLGQTDFVQNINAKRAAEGELARTIRSIQGVNNAKVLLNIPKKALFEQEQDEPSASVMIESGGRKLSPDQVRTIRNLVAAATPNLKPERVAISDQTGALLAGMDDAAGGAGASGARTETEERIRKQVKDLVEGVVGVGKARVTVAADVDTSRVTTQEEKFDPDGQVVRSSSTGQDNSKEDKPSNQGGVSASQNLPGAQAIGGGSTAQSTANKTDETTNYEISSVKTTKVIEPGALKKLSVSVAVDGVTAPGVGGKPGAYTARSDDEMKRIDTLVRAAIGFDEKRGDQIQVVNVRFDRPPEAAAAGGLPFSLDKSDIMRIAELAVLFVVTGLLIFFVIRPMLSPGAGGGTIKLPGGGTFQIANGMTLAADGASGGAIAMDSSGNMVSLPGGEFEQKIDIAKIEGQVRASSVKKVSEFIENHPEESVSILRSWLHEG